MKNLTWLFAAGLLVACGEDHGDPSSGHGSSGPGGAGAGGAGASGTLPCEVDAVLAKNCRSCHSSPPRYGAPMSLASDADVQAPAKSDPSRKVYELMKERLHDATRPMPPSGDLPAADLGTLDAWLAKGAPGGMCADGGGGAGGGGSPPIGPDALPCKPTHSFVAHAQGASGAYQVPEQGADNLYECFTFKSPFNGTTEGTAWAPIIGDERVLHHWILYRTPTAQVDGGVGPCNMPGDATFVAGWAPGGMNFIMPDNVGLELGSSSDSLILQVHYHNIDHLSDALDTSGVALCTTDTPRAHQAGIYTLGSVKIDIPPHSKGITATGTCPSWATKFLPEPVTVVATFPHMHKLGRVIRTEVQHGGMGVPDALVDVQNFSFDDQRFYVSKPPFIVNPGDAITTTCVYDNPGDQTVKFGEKTEDEMCFDFVLLYPITLFQGGNRQCGLF